jgi:YebC/PmpR family DNA-binding regulatory protein
MMAGHNKWSKIKRTKAPKDVARSSAFAKASRAIAAASRACGGDLSNLQLQSAIQHDKSIQMPKDRIQDAIDKFMKNKGGAAASSSSLESVRYDAMMNFDGQKVACLIIALTDNRNRTATSVRTTINKAGGELLPTNALSYLFDHVGIVVLGHHANNNNNTAAADDNEDALYEVALEAGATDFVEDNNRLVICEASDLWKLVTALRESGYVPLEFEQHFVLSDSDNAVGPLSMRGAAKLNAFLEKLDEDMDISNIYHNAILSEEEEEEETND